MARTLTVVPYVAGAYGAAITRTIAAWGIADEIPFSFRSQTADELTFSFAGQALLDNNNFPYRSRVTLTCDGKPFFQGYVPNDQARDFDGGHNGTSLQILGPWWYLENIVFMLTVQIVTDYDNAKPPAPILTAQTCTHFTLNQKIVTSTPNGGISYLPVVLNSQDQIAAILDFAIAAGAYLQYTKANLLNVPVLPRDVLNISCADAIRRQMEDTDCVAWFDHTTTPPTFNCKRRVDMPNTTQKLATTGQMNALGVDVKARGFKGLKQRFDLKVPSVRIDFEQQNSLGGTASIKITPDIYPLPLPADRLGALIITVPLRGFTATISQQWIKTTAIDPNKLAFWNLVKPETDVLKNPNAAVEYFGAAIVAASAIRQSALPNMIIEGGYADWMGGSHAEDNITAVATYERRVSTAVPGTKIAAHTWQANVNVTDLNYPTGYLATTINGGGGENPANFVGMAQIIYTDLNTPQYEGEIPLFEGVFSGTIVLGVNYNLANGRAEHANMNALAQQVSGTSKGAGIFYSVSVGPNKNISAGQFADRLRAKRQAYITCVAFSPSGGSVSSSGARSMKHTNTSTGEPQDSVHTTSADYVP